MSKELPVRLLHVAQELREIAHEYRELKFEAGEEAMTWPVSIIVDDDGKIGMWCAKKDCLLDGHNSEIYIEDPGDFTMAQVLYTLIGHIEYNKERQDDL